jgi:hypothetical protein
MNLQLIKNYCESRQGGLKQLAEDCNMSEANLHRCIRLNKIQASDLEKIASLILQLKASMWRHTVTRSRPAVTSTTVRTTPRRCS